MMATSWTIGSSSECDLVIDQPVVSGRHCRLTSADDGYLLEDLGSTNGTYVNGERITTGAWVNRADYVTLGRKQPMPWPELRGSGAPDRAPITRIGREEDNDLVVRLATVSGYHARVVWRGEAGEAVIEDLGSTNGTFVNGRQVERFAPARVGDVIHLGTYRFTLTLLSTDSTSAKRRDAEVEGPGAASGNASNRRPLRSEDRSLHEVDASPDRAWAAKAPAPFEPDWPVIRVEKKSWRGKLHVTRVRPDGISFLTTREDLIEVVLSSARAGWEHIGLKEITSLRVERIGYVSSKSLWLRFRLQSTRGTRKFRVPDRDAPNLLRAFSEILGERFAREPRRRMSLGEMVLAVLGALGLIGVVVGGLGSLFVSSSYAAAAIFGLIVLVLVGIGVLALKGDRSRSEFRETPPTKPRKRRRAGRQPFRSPVLGWGLKLCGAFYILYVLFSGTATELASRANDDSRVLWVVYAPGVAALVAGYHLCLKTFDPARHPDPRPPVLFLRSFDDDGKGTFQPRNWLAQLHGIYRFQDVFTTGTLAFMLHPAKLIKLFLNCETYSAEELLGAAFRRCGPFVAIGRPGELLVTAGADRMYVPDDVWQKTVLKYLAESQSVILQPAQSDGVRWEMEQVLKVVPKHKILLSLLNFKDRPNLFEDFRGWLRNEYGHDLPMDLPFRKEPVFAYFDVDGTVQYQPVCYRTPLLWTFVGNAVDTSRTFDAFIRGLRGGPRDAPALPREYPGHAALSVLLVLILAIGAAIFAAALE